MKKITLLVSIIVVCSNTNFLHSQQLRAFDSIRCQTPMVDSATFFNLPWFGNNQFLLSLVDSVEGGGTSIYPPSPLRIPVTAWVYHNVNNADNIADFVVEQYINAINTFYINSGVNIRLYLRCGIHHIINPTYYNGVNGSNYDNMFNTYYTPRTLNIHFTNGSDGVARGRFPWIQNPYACYIPTFWSDPFVGNTLVPALANVLTHETGHALGLLHTHDGGRGRKDYNWQCGACYQESVSRTRTQGAGCISTIGKKKCEVNGDVLCDTDGDPLLQDPTTHQVYVLPNCSAYDIANSPYKQDRWGANWLPTGNNNAIINIMSYSTPNCRLQMTQMQRGVEYFVTLNRWDAYQYSYVYNYPSFYNNPNVDNYENDNNFQNATPILFNTVQQHSFHLTPDQNSNYTGCDVDWLIYIPTCSGTYSIETSAFSDQPYADTRLTLFNSTLTQLAQNDNISTSNHFSKITYNFVARTTYYIQCDNVTPNVIGYYNIAVGQLKFSDASPNIVCSSATFTIDNLPNSSSVTWSSSNTNIATVNNQGLVTKVNNGQITLTATISAPCFSGTQTVSKIITVGGPLISGTYTNKGQQYPLMYYTGGNTYNNACNLFHVYTNMQVTGASSLTWTRTAGSVYYTQTGNNISFYFFAVNQSAVFNVSASNGCGTSSSNFGWISVDCGGCPINFAISPNPATNSVSVIPNIPPACDRATGNIGIQRIKIYNNQGILKKLINYPANTKQARINVSDLYPGVYMMDISTGATSVRKTFIIQK